jgi:hypothetical protein
MYEENPDQSEGQGRKNIDIIYKEAPTTPIGNWKEGYSYQCKKNIDITIETRDLNFTKFEKNASIHTGTKIVAKRRKRN